MPRDDNRDQMVKKHSWKSNARNCEITLIGEFEEPEWVGSCRARVRLAGAGLHVPQQVFQLGHEPRSCRRFPG